MKQKVGRRNCTNGYLKSSIYYENYDKRQYLDSFTANTLVLRLGL